ncbi:MAG: DNA polymerase IV [Bacillota bacterium]|nr:DNA polymerase IV [Bacillota bacterium]
MSGKGDEGERARPGGGRAVLHCDADAFFAAVEVLDRPELAGKPVIVGGLGPRGVVATCSYEARRFGVHSAMPMTTARRLCPQAVFLPGRHERYRQVSRQMFAVFERFSPVIEPLSLDEAFLEAPAAEAERLAVELRAQVRREIGLAVSVGVGPNKLVAKIASDLAKPDGLRVVRPGEVAGFLAPLSVRRLWGIGPRTAEALEQEGIRTVADLRARPEAWFRQRFGQRWEQVRRFALGEDDRPVAPPREAKSMGEEETYPRDLEDRRQLLRRLAALSQAVGARLRAHGLAGRTVTLKLRTGDYRTRTRSRTLPQAVAGDDQIYREAVLLLERAWGGEPVRLLGVQLSGLERPRSEQLSLLERGEGRPERLWRTVDELRARFGPRAVLWGAAEESRPSRRMKRQRREEG